MVVPVFAILNKRNSGGDSYSFSKLESDCYLSICDFSKFDKIEFEKLINVLCTSRVWLDIDQNKT
jgi:hypothetical protein